MDPLEDFVKAAAAQFRSESTPDGWRRAASDQMELGLPSGRLTFR
jgi:hypothetical protein